MPRYSDFIERLFLQAALFSKLTPAEPISWDLVRRVREAGDEQIAGATPISDARLFATVRGALLYALDDLDGAHRHFQEEKRDIGSYWHGMMHRREGDFDNARYWYRRAGRLPFFQRLHREAMEHSSLMARQHLWDPYLFTGECEQVRFGAELAEELPKLQRTEFEVAFDYTWRQSTGQSADE